MNRTLKFRIFHGDENSRELVFLDIEKDIINLNAYKNPIINQFTGFTDDYGSEIYEGDVLSIVGNSLSKFTVTYDMDTFIVESDKSTLCFIDKAPISKFLSIEKNSMKKKVIGNIIENEK